MPLRGPMVNVPKANVPKMNMGKQKTFIGCMLKSPTRMSVWRGPSISKSLNPRYWNLSQQGVKKSFQLQCIRNFTHDPKTSNELSNNTLSKLSQDQVAQVMDQMSKLSKEQFVQVVEEVKKKNSQDHVAKVMDQISQLSQNQLVNLNEQIEKEMLRKALAIILSGLLVFVIWIILCIPRCHHGCD